MPSAKDDILQKVGHALGKPPVDRAADYAAIARRYLRSGALTQEQRLELFADRLHDYDAIVHYCAESEIAATVALALTARNKRGLTVSRDLPPAWLPPGFDFAREQAFSYEEINRTEGVLTGCEAAIALTGTIILRHSSEHGRRALTLIPDYHLCVVFARQVVDTVPEGFAAIAAFATAPITTISGPSATSDIEMTRIKGVHGPRTLEVILVQTTPVRL